MIRPLVRWMRLPARDRWITAEAGVALAIGAAMVAFMPFKRIVARVEAGQAAIAPEVAAAPAIVLVKRAVERAARGAFWRTKCFEQGLAAHWLLRRRGVPSTLFYGVRKTAEEGLLAHVWLRAADMDVVGCEIADRYAELMRFPAPDRS